MDLDVLFPGAEVGGNLLVELAGDDVLHDLALAWCEAGQADSQGRGLQDGLVSGLRRLKGGAHGPDQRSRIHGLGEEIGRTDLDGAHTHGYVTVPGEENDGDQNTLVGETLLQLQAVQLGHRHVQHQTGGVLRVAGIEERANGRETPHLEPLGAQQTGQGFDHLRVVVEQEDSREWRGAGGGVGHLWSVVCNR